FFFQAEDGIRDFHVTGVQTCALPIFVITEIPYQVNKAHMIEKMAELVRDKRIEGISDIRDESDRQGYRVVVELKRDANAEVVMRSEERRVGKECRARWAGGR